METATNALNRLNENQAFGSSVGFQLEDMERRQKIFAQKLISDIVFHGKLGNLNEYSVINLNSSHCPPTNVPNFSRRDPYVQPATNSLPGFNYGHEKYPSYHQYVPQQSSKSHAPNNTTNLTTKQSLTGEVDHTDPIQEEDDNIGQYLVFNQL